MAVKRERDRLVLLDSSRAARQLLRELAKRALTLQGNTNNLRSEGRVIHEGTLTVAKDLSWLWTYSAFRVASRRIC